VIASAYSCGAQRTYDPLTSREGLGVLRTLHDYDGAVGLGKPIGEDLIDDKHAGRSHGPRQLARAEGHFVVAEGRGNAELRAGGQR